MGGRLAAEGPLDGLHAEGRKASLRQAHPPQPSNHGYTLTHHMITVTN
jgi:hypothetical protein